MDGRGLAVTISDDPDEEPNRAENRPIVLVLHLDLFAGPVHSPYLSSLTRSLPGYRFLILTDRILSGHSIGKWPGNVEFVWRNSLLATRLEQRLPPSLARLFGVWLDTARCCTNRRLLRRLTFDLIHVHAGVEVENLIRVGRKLRLAGLWVIARWFSDFTWTDKPVLFTEHSLFSRRSELGFPNPFHEADLTVTSAYPNVICVDRDAYEFLSKYDAQHSINRRRWLVPNGINTEAFAFAKLATRNTLRIGYSGRLFRSGESRTFLSRVAKRLPEAVELHLAVASPLGEDEIRRQWFSSASVVLHRNIPNNSMPDFYRSIDMLVNPLLWGGVGRSSLEAMSCGRPVVMFSNADRYPVSEKTGYLIGPEDVDEFLALALRLRDNREDIASRGRRAREIVDREFSESGVGLATARVYESLVGKTSKGPSALHCRIGKPG